MPLMYVFFGQSFVTKLLVSCCKTEFNNFMVDQGKSRRLVEPTIESLEFPYEKTEVEYVGPDGMSLLTTEPE